MKVRLKRNLIVVTAETDEERQTVGSWAQDVDGHVFALTLQDGQTFRLTSLGPRPEACREPINVTSRSPDPAIRLISNFAESPFELDGMHYGSVEAFWQGLKFPESSRRLEIAPLSGDAARRAGFDAPNVETFDYHGQSIRVGTVDHWRLMSLACWAKFSQHEASKQALLGTGERPLVHKTRRDSRSIPGLIMADIWMKVRRGLINQKGVDALEDEAQSEDPQVLPDQPND